MAPKSLPVLPMPTRMTPQSDGQSVRLALKETFLFSDNYQTSFRGLSAKALAEAGEKAIQKLLRHPSIFYLIHILIVECFSIFFYLCAALREIEIFRKSKTYKHAEQRCNYYSCSRTGLSIDLPAFIYSCNL
jgi:hypothetical protein